MCDVAYDQPRYNNILAMRSQFLLLFIVAILELLLFVFFVDVSLLLSFTDNFSVL